MDSFLYQRALQGATILTVNKRLARSLNGQYDLARRDEGLAVWPRAEIVCLAAWLNGQLPELPEGAAVLSVEQSLRVWEMIVEDDLAGSAGQRLLQVPQTARRALQAHQLLIQHAADFSAQAAAEDHRAFLRWREQWRLLAARNQWRDSAETLRMVADAYEKHQLPPPEQVVLAGFDQLTPDIHYLINALQHCNCRVEEWQPPAGSVACRLQVAALDPADEVRQCARWVRQVLSEEPSASIGIVAPQLDLYQQLFASILTAELDPSAVLSGDEIPDVFTMSLGRRLDREGPVSAALRLLKVSAVMDAEEISWLLRSPYIGHARQECSWRARLDAELRKLGQVEWPLQRLLQSVRSFARRSGQKEPQIGKIFEVLAKETRTGTKKFPGDWAEHFIRLLRDLGWPGDRGLSSREYQVVEAFSNVLSRMTGLDRVATPVSRHIALGMLGRLVTQTEFQPEAPTAAVQVLGILESAGLSFDHLWVVGLHDMALPQTPSPNPFIPLAVQRRHGMPRADAEHERMFAEQVVRRLFSAAPQVYLSWPRQVDGLERRPSPLLAGIETGAPPMLESVDPASLIWHARPEMEHFTDDMGPSLNSKKSFAGGTGILKDQALCPFRAFGHHRLKAVQLESPEIGLDNMARGTLAHAVLELFWKETRDRAALVSLEDMVLTERIAHCVEQAVVRFEKEKRCDLPPRQRNLEKRRLAVLARQWLGIEMQRTPFRVEGTEITRQLAIGSLRIRTRVDRIDQLEDGSLVVLDYKTGRPDPGQWFDDRVTEPQLPAYCLDLPHRQIAAVLFAVVRGKRSEAGFSGLARVPEDWPGLSRKSTEALLKEKQWDALDDVLDHWSKALTALAGAFTRGEASVDPVSYEVACKYCDLTPLCRINDLTAHLSLLEDRHD
jgi:probable DNA repair protein